MANAGVRAAARHCGAGGYLLGQRAWGEEDPPHSSRKARAQLVDLRPMPHVMGPAADCFQEGEGEIKGQGLG